MEERKTGGRRGGVEERKTGGRRGGAEERTELAPCPSLHQLLIILFSSLWTRREEQE